MKISIITPTFNSASTLKDTLESIERQSYQDKEHIIIDGKSTDGTLAMAEEYAIGKSWVKIISEKDRGIYDAMNKGIALASGDIVHILNSDDFYTDSTVLDQVIQKFSTGHIDVCYSDMVLIDRKDSSKITRKWNSGDFEIKNINNGWAPPHPTLFVKREVYSKLGNFSLDFPIASDYHFMFRLMQSPTIQWGYIPKILIYMRDSGNSGNSLRQRIAGWQELKKSWIQNNRPLPFLFILRRIISKIPQYVRPFFKK